MIIGMGGSNWHKHSTENNSVIHSSVGAMSQVLSKGSGMY